MEWKSTRQYSTGNRALGLFAGLFLTAILVGCGGDDGGGMEPPPPPTLVEQGWDAFESGDFGSAASRFQEAINNSPGNADAHNGLGWANMMLDDLSGAVTSFDAALTNGFTGADPHAGKAIVQRDLAPVDYNAAIASANAALGIDTNYAFEHDTSLNWQDLRLILAQSHFALGQYTEANTQVGALAGNVQDGSSSTFVEDLLAEIERLSEMFGG